MEVCVGSVVIVFFDMCIIIMCFVVGMFILLVVWSRGDELIYMLLVGNMIVVYIGILIIDVVFINDMGDYFCIVMSEVGVD